MSHAALGAAEAAALIRTGELDAEALVGDCLARIGEVDPAIEAWAYLDPDFALAQAREADRTWRAGGSMGPLHGVPVGIKDIIDTADMPTENGTPIHAGRRPEEDAWVVSLLLRAGAVILGKTVTTELAVYTPGKTRNPHDPERTPGGSSSGSAAAVAAAMVPVALGTQTNGSVIRPASYCGVFGYKPSHGLVSRSGVLPQSRALDTVGLFARGIDDLALLGSVIMGHDGRDPDMRPSAPPALRELAAAEPPAGPDLAFVETPVWAEATGDCKAAFAELVDVLGRHCEPLALPEPFAEAVAWHRDILCPDIAHSFAPFYARAKESLSARLVAMIEDGQALPAIDYIAALEGRKRLAAILDAAFDDYDAIVTPATTGAAPRGLDTTGSPIFCTLWTLCGNPSVSLPLLRDGDGMPIGVQLVGRRGDDARLLRTARWLTGQVESAA